MNKIRWYAGCDGIKRMGPFASQADAWKAVLLTEANQRSSGRIHAAGSYVWCEL